MIENGAHGAERASGSDIHAMEFLKLHFGKKFFIFNDTVHIDTLFYSWLIILILIIVSILARRKIGVIPTKIQGLFEIIYNWLRSMAEDMIGPDGKKYVPFVMTIFLFVLLSNWTGLIPSFIPPSRDYNFTLGMAIVSFLSFTFIGIARAYQKVKEEKKQFFLIFIIKGFWQWFSHFFQPAPGLWHVLEGPMRYIMVPFMFVLFFVLNVIEELARIVSLSVRLMGNIMGEHLAISVFLSMVLMAGLMIPAKFLVWGSSAFVMIIGTLTGFIQAMIFAVLTLSYIAHAVAEEH